MDRVLGRNFEREPYQKSIVFFLAIVAIFRDHIDLPEYLNALLF